MPEKSSSFKRGELRTQVVPAPPGRKVAYNEGIMLMGSCFTEHIGIRLKNLKFNTCLNPFGIVYNPLSMARQLSYLINPSGFGNDDLFQHEGLWHSWMHHGRFSSPDPATILRAMASEAAEGSRMLAKSGLLLLTFGTAEAWFLNESGKLVSNCHKVPADRFYTRRAGPEELADAWIPVLQSLFQLNPSIQIGLTISPVRYFREGPTANQLSKSVLFLFIENLMSTFPGIWYFPAYEIFMDDLRDYRFYDTDMVHPGDSGIEYVWNRFATAILDKAALDLMPEVESVMKAAAHRPGIHRTDGQVVFEQALAERMKALSTRYPFLDFAEELEALSSR